MRQAAWGSVVAALVLPFAALAADQSWKLSSRWSAQTTPKRGPARSIGGYAAGCVRGAAALPAEGPGFEVMHRHRRRYFGHPALVEFVRRLAKHADAEGLPILLIGDLSQPRGGPTPSDHGSHQSGLDVDVAYTRPVSLLSLPMPTDEREGLEPPAVVDLTTHGLTPAWRPQIADLLELAAKDPVVDRIFVNAGVKRKMCELGPRGAPWLAKLRPWWGHHDHFHVRLACPAGSSECKSQPPVPAGDGCDETLDWWFEHETHPPIPRPHRAAPGLPGSCRAVLR
jgi:penicillin-insensitive murein DD-endopeptidase